MTSCVRDELCEMTKRRRRRRSGEEGGRSRDRKTKQKNTVGNETCMKHLDPLTRSMKDTP